MKIGYVFPSPYHSCVAWFV